ncbi:MobV family relaxase [Clostridium sp.]
MSWEDFRDKPLNTTVNDATFKSTNSSFFYAIFRIAEKYKTVGAIVGFQNHMERENEVANADRNIENEILIGSKNVKQDVKNYITDIKIRKNAVIARGLLMSASPDFFRGLGKEELNRWKTDNIKFLKDNFGDNCIYATLHKDERTWHIHALIVPKFKNKKGENILSNTRYFDGIEKMRAWQDNYSENMKEHFKCLNRGTRFSKRKHMEVKMWYALIKQNLNEHNLQQLTAKAKNSELLEIKIKAIEKTLQIYKNYNSKNELEKNTAILESKSLVKEITKIKEDKETYKQALSMLSQQYRIPKYVISEAVRICENINEKEL